MDKFQNPPHIPMDTSSTIPTQVSGQTSAMVSLDTDALIAARQGAAWKISGWPENITIHHAKGCACCHEYIDHLCSNYRIEIGAVGIKNLEDLANRKLLSDCQNTNTLIIPNRKLLYN